MSFIPFVGALTVAAGVGGLALVVRLWRGRADAVLRWPDAGHWSETLPVLGGHEPSTHAWSRFHLRYYPMTLVLVAFEMEMMVMYPWAVVYVELGTEALVEMGVFLTLLSLGVLYAWREGALRWQ